jgi:murein DD-endopeptidase MepM/ murein hydrolase activator NlpD
MRQILNQANPATLSREHRRHGLIAGIAATFMALGMAAAFGTSQSTVVFEGKISNIVEQISVPALDQVEPQAALLAREVRIQRGDTISSLFANMGIVDPDALTFMRNDPGAEPISRQLAPGKTVTALVDQEGNLGSLIFPLNGEKDNVLRIQRTADNFSATSQKITINQEIVQRTATIRHSLFGAADDAGIPDGIAVQLADIFGGDIDFHRDLRKGDTFSVIYETSSHLGKEIGIQRILAAEFINNGKTYRAYWYQPAHTSGGYYTEDGRSVRKAFLRSPLEFSRITSGFSSARYHPVLKETRAHRGIDYGAPTGTRVKTTGDGVIECAEIQGGYGKVVMVRHSGDRTTVYGHLSGFAPGIKKGTRVSQGEVIGYVGATGIATGPHLHYEFRVQGVHRNPLTVALPDAAPLPATVLSSYKASATDLTKQIDSIRNMQLVLLD